MLHCEVAVPVPLSHPFTYSIPERLAGIVVPGVRVACEFGRAHKLAVVLSVSDGPVPMAESRLKPILSVLDTAPSVPAELLGFLRELASYYLAPIGEVLRLAMPALERAALRELQSQGLFERQDKAVGGRMMGFARAIDTSGEAPRLGPSATKLLAHLRATGEAPVSQLKEIYPSAPTILKKLAELGLVHLEQRERALDPFFEHPSVRDTPPVLTDEQLAAVDAIDHALGDRAAKALLLAGVTGSGKTEVYLRAIATCLQQGRGALVLVPEIALTPQLVSRFRARFGDSLAVLHSGMSERARHEMWRMLREARVKVAIGARSALFAPVPELGLVIVDEEHDGSFKQEEGVRYHARDMALLRAHRAGATCVLGSATPSLESEALARSGKLQRLRLIKRAHATASLPKVEIVDLRRTGPGPSGNPLLSLPMHRAIEKVLAAGQQAILFLNRRGFAPSVLCEGCGTIASCPHCSVSLTMHRSGGVKLRCHYCDYETAMWEKCAKCACERLVLIGLGTERLEDALCESFPTARVLRLDRDVAAGARSEAVLDRMRKRQADILVGTQMVTKGHDLPDVTLVGVILADAALSLPDFRASERTFQLLVQVAGRAGRAEHAGLVLVQTRLPDHPVLRFALKHDVAGFVDHELGNRREANYPPFSRLVLIRLDSAKEERVKEEAQRLADVASRQAARQGKPMVEVLGPSPAPLERLRGRYRYRVLLRASDRAPLRAVAKAVQLAAERTDRAVRVSLDVDPVQML
ncbi:MAG: primosomal protein N' [Deltaproteobacteria bacterium]|nr:primosomal protein N' [Deltaproteobacteria bacterium]